MEDRAFDLTIPVTRQFRTLWTIMGVIWIINGLLSIRSRLKTL